jgi:signal transduction histidine kinase
MQRYCSILVFYILISAFQSKAQTQLIERLKYNIEEAKFPAKKLHAIFDLCEERQSLSTDTLCKYATIAKEISVKLKDLSNIALAEYYMGNCLVKQGLLDTALQICNKSIDRFKEINVNVLMKLTLLKAQVLIRSNKHKEGIATCYKLLQTAEQNKDTVMQMLAKNALGWVNMEMDQPQEALDWFFKALNTSENPLYHERNSNIYSNIAAIYKQLNQNDSAENFIKTSIIYSRKNQNIFFLANSLNILADIYINTKRPALAEAPLNEALNIRKLIGDPFYVVSDMSQLAIYYAHIGQPAKGIALCQQGIQLAKKLNLTSKLPYLYQALGENYKASGNYVEYSKTLEVVMNLKDSMYSATSAEARAEMDIKYNLQKNENIIIQQQLDLLRKNYIMYGTLTLILFAAIVSWLLFKNYKRKQKILLQSLKEEEKLKAMQAVMSAEENERKRISADLHDNLGAYASAISANADDLSMTLGSVDSALIKSIKNNAAEIMMSLRDTIWVLNKNEILLTGVSDRFKNYLRNIREAYPALSIELKEEITEDIALSPQVALNMLRIMQEAFHNAIKHSKGTHVVIELISESGLTIRITDNGSGILHDENKNGNGLLNMQMRARANGWKLFVKNLQPRGTSVELYA